MNLHSQDVAAYPVSAGDLGARLLRFMTGASTEITPADEQRLPDLARLLPTGTAIYVAHTPGANVSDVVRTSLAVRRSGFVAVPHIVARRLPNALTLRNVLRQLCGEGIDQILLIAGDSVVPTGEFSSTLEVIESGLLEQAGIQRIGVAGHPEGHKNVGPMLLWESLEAKQMYAHRMRMSLYIVTQFTFNANAILEWEAQLRRHEIRLPVHVGIAGPATLPRLIHYAMRCGIGASLRTVMRNLSAVGSITDLAITPEQHLMRLILGDFNARIVAPHFFSLGGCIATARWMRQLTTGCFTMDSSGQILSVQP